MFTAIAALPAPTGSISATGTLYKIDPSQPPEGRAGLVLHPALRRRYPNKTLLTERGKGKIDRQDEDEILASADCPNPDRPYGRKKKSSARFPGGNNYCSRSST